MHRIHTPSTRHVPRSKLGSTLLQLHRSLEHSHQQEKVALKAFEDWQSRWSEQRHEISRRLAILDQELCALAQLKETAQLMIVNPDEPEPLPEDEAPCVKISFPQR